MNLPETTLEVGLFLPQALTFIITEKLIDSFELNTLWNIQDLHVGFGPLSAAFIFFGVAFSYSMPVFLISKDICIQKKRLCLSR